MALNSSTLRSGRLGSISTIDTVPASIFSSASAPLAPSARVQCSDCNLATSSRRSSSFELTIRRPRASLAPRTAAFEAAGAGGEIKRLDMGALDSWVFVDFQVRFSRRQEIRHVLLRLEMEQFAEMIETAG